MASHGNRRVSPLAVANTLPEYTLDTDAAVRYPAAVGLQMAAITATFGAIDAVTDATLGGALPWQAVCFLFFGLSIRSRLFSPLDNSRPDREAAIKGEATAGFGDRIMPSWTPPGVVCESPLIAHVPLLLRPPHSARLTIRLHQCTQSQSCGC